MPQDGRAVADRFPSEEVKRILLAMAGSVASSRFVGRAAELGRLEAAFGHARDGELLTLCVGGEAGVGKTRLVTRFAEQVQGSGGQVLLGGCVELGETALPYAPLAQALRGLGRGLEPAALNELAGPGRPLLARLLPELERSEEPASAGTTVGSSGQARLFEALLALLERLAGRSPTVLVVEDLHWADRSTLDLLAFLVRNLQAGLLVVLTYRTDELHRRHPLRPFLAELDRSGRADRLELPASTGSTRPTCWPASSGAGPTTTWSSGSGAARRATRSSPRSCSRSPTRATPTPAACPRTCRTSC